MDFPILELMDQHACYQRLVDLLHPGGLTCPRCAAGRDRYTIHRHHKDSPVVDFRCTACGRVFNLFTGTDWQGTHRSPAALLLILRGFAQGVPTAALARELGASRRHLLDRRHAAQARAAAAGDPTPLPDAAVEADEMYQNAGEKRRPAPGPRRPAAAAGEQGARPRHLGQRPAAGGGGGRAGDRAAAAVPGQADVGGVPRGVRRGDDAAGGARLDRRVGGVRRPAGAGPAARRGAPRRGTARGPARVGAG